MKNILLKDGQDSAKKILCNTLSSLHDTLGLRLTIVYDGKGQDINIERIGRHLTFSEVYTPSSMSADEFIEQMCSSSKHPENIIVASEDSLVRLTTSGFSAETISNDRLIEWAKSVEKLTSKDTINKTEQSQLIWQKEINPFRNPNTKSSK